MSAAKHTPGPWRWEFNESHKVLSLVGGRPIYDLTVVGFERWGMRGATMMLRDTSEDGMNILFRVHERRDWIAPEPGREHHKSWHQLLIHPDARLIAAAPELLEALRHIEGAAMDIGCERAAIRDAASAAIAKATGEQNERHPT
jgi:hypothetical protein